MKNCLFKSLNCISPFFLMLIAFILIQFNASPSVPVRAENSDSSYGIILPEGKSLSNLNDHSVITCEEFIYGDVIKITNADSIKALYLEWDLGITEWQLFLDGEAVTCGQNKFLHDYIVLPKSAHELLIQIPENGAVMCGLYVFENYKIPDFVQLWNSPSEDCDLLLVSSHSDDEILFFGATLPYYAAEMGYDVQVIYLTYHTKRVRSHELLNGLWASGIRNYPVIGPFVDENSTLYSLFNAKTFFGSDNVKAYFTEQLRRFKPEVVISHDIYGEYGHGAHQLCARMIAETSEHSMEADYCPESAEKYGIWAIKKLYLHLHSENKIDMEWDMVMPHYNDKKGYEVAEEILQNYASQLRFGYEITRDTSSVYDCTRFGLYRSTVGSDLLKNDFFENITYNTSSQDACMLWLQ